MTCNCNLESLPPLASIPFSPHTHRIHLTSVLERKYIIVAHYSSRRVFLEEELIIMVLWRCWAFYQKNSISEKDLGKRTHSWHYQHIADQWTLKDGQQMDERTEGVGGWMSCGCGRKFSDLNYSPTNTRTTNTIATLDIPNCLPTFKSPPYHATVQKPNNVAKQ